MDKELNYLDDLTNNALGNMQITPKMRWTQFETKLVNNNLVANNNANQSVLQKTFDNIISSFRYKLGILTGVVAVTIVVFTFLNKQDEPKSQINSIYQKNITKVNTEDRKLNVQLLKDKNIAKETKNILSDTENVLTKEKNTTPNTDNATDSTNIAKKQVTIKKQIIVTDTIK